MKSTTVEGSDSGRSPASTTKSGLKSLASNSCRTSAMFVCGDAPEMLADVSAIGPPNASIRSETNLLFGNLSAGSCLDFKTAVSFPGQSFSKIFFTFSSLIGQILSAISREEIKRGSIFFSRRFLISKILLTASVFPASAARP